MRKKYYLNRLIICSFLLLIGQNVAWAINCSEAKTPIEKSICTKDSALYYYDPILNTIYHVLAKTLPPEKFQLLKKQQLQWLKQLKPDGADTSYAKRMSELSIQYKDYLQPYYLNALAQGKMSSTLSYAFMWFFYSDYDMSGDYSDNFGMLDVRSTFSILKLSSDQFIIAGQFNDFGEITNSDGGVFSFYLAEPSKNKITLLKVQDDGRYDSTVQVSRVASLDPVKKQMVLASYDGTTSHYSINLEKMRLDLLQ